MVRARAAEAAGAAADRAGAPEAAGFRWPVVPEVPGVHCMVPAPGPVAPNGWCKAAAGTVAWKWACRRCGTVANNSTKLLAVVRTACGGAEGVWEQRNHNPEVHELRVQCTRCGTSRQRHVQLGSQRCPVRCLTWQAAEVPAGTAVYAAWHTAIKAMHHRSRPAAEVGEPPVLAVVGAGDAGAGDAGAGDAGAGDVVAAMPCQLRPFRAHSFASPQGASFASAATPRPPVTGWPNGEQAVATGMPRLGQLQSFCWPRCTFRLPRQVARRAR